MNRIREAAMPFVLSALGVLALAGTVAAAPCGRCKASIDEAFNFCPHCGLPQKDLLGTLWEDGRQEAARKEPEEASPRRASPSGGIRAARVLRSDARQGWYWIDKGKDQGMTWGRYYTVHHENRWKALVRARSVTPSQTRCKLILGSIADMRAGYRLAPFENLPYEEVLRRPDAYVGSLVVWYGRLVGRRKRGDEEVLHLSTTFQDDFRELKETFGRQRGLFKTYQVGKMARGVVENSIVKGSFLAVFRGELPSIDKDAKVLVVGSPIQQIASRAADGSSLPVPTVRIHHVKFWRR